MLNTPGLLSKGSGRTQTKLMCSKLMCSKTQKYGDHQENSFKGYRCHPYLEASGS